MADLDVKALEKLAASFDARAERAFGDVGYTRSGYLTRDSVGLKGMGIAFETAARELRALLKTPEAGS
jgi:hypothetical protein